MSVVELPCHLLVPFAMASEQGLLHVHDAQYRKLSFSPLISTSSIDATVLRGLKQVILKGSKKFTTDFHGMVFLGESSNHKEAKAARRLIRNALYYRMAQNRGSFLQCKHHVYEVALVRTLCPDDVSAIPKLQLLKSCALLQASIDKHASDHETSQLQVILTSTACP